ncbi:glutathione S-transferase family protein [Rhodanobacter ginsengisoli]|uniref:Glutathione S-transferase family protein n=1 Tax=Rhodanobacter ginsengisoli TaxID=418646 RepID=A0ABW0QHV2_9GAMM
MNKIVVWGFRWAPPFAQGLVRDLRVRWALEEAGQAYDVELIDFQERHAAAHRRRQPFGMVPAFEADGRGLFESAAIVHRIAADSAALMPADAHARAEVLTWMFAALNTVEPPIQNLLEMDLLHAGEPWVELRRPAVVAAVTERLAALSAALAGRDHLVDRFTAADILMTTVLRFLRHTELVAGFPLLDAYVKRCEARPAFRRALDQQMADFARHAPVAA